MYCVTSDNNKKVGGCNPPSSGMPGSKDSVPGRLTASKRKAITAERVNP